MRYATADILVAGGGPAGCIAAIVAARSGAKVMLVSPPLSSQRGCPVRVETAGRDVLELAGRLSVREAFLSARLGDVGPFFRDGRAASLNEVDRDGLNNGWHIDRKLLDKALLSQALSIGIDVTASRARSVQDTEEAVFTVCDDGTAYQSAALIDATGRMRTGMPGQRTPLSPPLLALTGVIDDDGTLPSRRGTSFASKDWGWLWSTGDLGGCVAWTAMFGAEMKCPREVEDLKRRTRTGLLHRTTTTWLLNQSNRPRVLPVGDASGSLDPASGRGLLNALTTGLMAGTIAGQITALRDAIGGVGEYHRRRKMLILQQANELASRYAACGILSRGHHGMESSTRPPIADIIPCTG